MLCLLPFMVGDMAKLRTWGALMGASLAALAAPSVVFFVIIDLIAAAIVVFPRPMNDTRAGIATLFVAMVLIEIAYVITLQDYGTLLFNICRGIGWAQLLILLSWGLHDFIRVGGFGERRVGGPLVSRRDSA